MVKINLVKKVNIMKKSKLLLFFLSVFITTTQAQTPCDKKLNKVAHVLKNTTPFSNDAALFKLVEPCALAGNAKAENYLGMFYLNGIGTKKDEDKAFTYIEKAAHSGYAAAQCNLGLLYKYGNGCQLDFKKAIAWFRKGSANGNQKAAYFLGYMYYKGFGVPQDYTKAVYWFNNSSYAMARHYLGLCYYLGYGVPANETKALEILLNNQILNSKTLVTSIQAEQKQRQEKQTRIALNTTAKANNPINTHVVLDTREELQHLPEEILELKDVIGNWTGKLIQYDWSGKHIRRILPIKITITTEQETGDIQVTSIVEKQELSSKATWQDETLYLEDLKETLTLNRLYPENPKQLTLDYNLFSTSLQKYEYEGVHYLIGKLDSYIPQWTEYGKPMSLVLKPEGAVNTNTENTLNEEALFALAAQKDQFIKLYPVPFNEQLTVQYQLETASNVYVELISLNGNHKIVIQPTTSKQAGDYTHTIPIDTSLPKGLYVVRIRAGNQLHTRMIIKGN